MNYEILLFDADETLFDFKKAEQYALEHSMKELSLPYDESYHLPEYIKINTAIWKELELGQITQEQLKTERFKRFSNALKLTIDAQLFAASYMHHLGNAAFLYEGSLELIESLYPYYQIAIITNGLKIVQENRIKKSVLAKYCKEIVISEEIHLAKPDARIFEYTLNRLHCMDKRKALMLGDNLTSDIAGGINAGIDTCWFNPSKRVNQTEIHPTYEVSDFEAIKQLLLTK